MADKRLKEKAWEKAGTIRGKDPGKYRKDPYGNVIYKACYGRNSDMGWEVDHIRPRSRGGSDTTRNVQALNTGVNRHKRDDMRKKTRHSGTKTRR